MLTHFKGTIPNSSLVKLGNIVSVQRYVQALCRGALRQVYQSMNKLDHRNQYKSALIYSMLTKSEKQYFESGLSDNWVFSVNQCLLEIRQSILKLLNYNGNRSKKASFTLARFLDKPTCQGKLADCTHFQVLLETIFLDKFSLVM